MGDSDSAKKDYISMKQAVWDIVVRFIPSGLTWLVEYNIILVNLIVVGSLGDPVLISGLGLGCLTVNIIVFSIDLGGGLDTLVSQAFGRKDYYSGSVYLSTSRIIVVVLFLPQALIGMNHKAIYSWLGQPEESAVVAGDYVIWILPGCLLTMLFECTKRFLSAEGIFNPMFYIILITVVIHTVNLYVFVILFEFRIKAVAIITGISYSLNFIMGQIYTNYWQEETHIVHIDILDPEPIYRIPEYMKYGVPSCLMMLVEWWSYEILNIFSGWLGANALATSIILMSIFDVVYSMPLGIAYAAISLIGHSLGEKGPQKAKTYAQAVYLTAIGVTAISITTFVIFKHRVVMIFTQSEEVIELFRWVLPLYTVCITTDMVQGASVGVIKAMGYQTYASASNFICYWGITIPAAYIFIFYFNYDYMGIWMGIPIGSSTLMAVYLILICRAPWKKLSEMASSVVHIEEAEASLHKHLLP